MLNILTINREKDLNLLLKESKDVLFPLNNFTKKIISNLLDTFLSKGGEGLAAPQIGYNVNIIACSYTRKREDTKILINPTFFHLNNLQVDD